MTKPVLQGSWIDIVHLAARDAVYWNRKTIAYTDADWQRLISHLRRDLGCEILVLTNVAVHDGWFLYPSQLPNVRHWPLRGSKDPVNAILSAAAAEQIAVFVGVGAYPGPVTGTFIPSAAHKADAMRWSRVVAEELTERYGNQKSFAGWYTSAELSFSAETGLLREEPVEWARALSQTLRQVRPLPVLTSPYHGWQVAKLQPDPAALRRSILDTGVDIFVPQDGIGFDRPENPCPIANSVEAFRRIAAALQGTKVRLWVNNEVFRFENDIPFQPLLPGPFARIRQQLEQIAPFGEKVLCYQMPGLMTSQKVCPGLGAPETEDLYRAYRQYLEER